MSPLPQAPPEQSVPTLSAELFSIPLENGRYLVYAPLRRAAFVANSTVVNYLAGLRGGTPDTRLDPDGTLRDFLARLEIVDAGPETPPISTFSGDPEPTSVTLFLTTTCNLRCTYCYASAGDTPRRFMSLETAVRGIDFVAANAARKGEASFEVAYHGGGEPTVHWKVLTASLAHARRTAAGLGLEVRAYSATNGYLNDAQIDWMVANLDGASLSFDGLPELHDANRPTTTGEGSSTRILHAIRRFDEAGFSYGIRVTVTHDQIALLPESIEFICRSSRAPRIQVEPAYQLGRWQNAPSAETREFIAAYREAQARAHRLGRELTYSAARLDTLTNHFCGVTQDSFCLSPDGNVSGCYENFSEQNAWAGTFFYGRPDRERGGYRFDLPVLNQLRGQTVENRAYCRGCFARWHCAGDCYHKALTVNGTGEFAGSDRCHITRELTRDQILARIARAGGLFWHEPPLAEAAPSAGKELLR
ncbi:MAG: radical SAM protein [Longimicrobiaceae bacterium]